MTIDLIVSTVAEPDLAGKLILGNWFTNDKLKRVGIDILNRHKFTCMGCSVKSRPSKQVPHGHMIPVNLEHGGLLALNENGICICPMCASTLAINWSVSSVSLNGLAPSPPGLLIYFPWATQAELNRLAMHALSVSASRKVGSSTTLESAVRDLDAAMVSMTHELGISLPIYRGKDGEFARSLSMLNAEFHDQRSELLSNVRWWPMLNYWSEIGKYFYKATYSSVHQSQPDLMEVLA